MGVISFHPEERHYISLLTLCVGHRWNEEHQVHQQWQSGGDGGNSGAVPERGHAEEAVVQPGKGSPWKLLYDG